MMSNYLKVNGKRLERLDRNGFIVCPCCCGLRDTCAVCDGKGYFYGREESEEEDQGSQEEEGD